MNKIGTSGKGEKDKKTEVKARILEKWVPETYDLIPGTSPILAEV